MDVVTSILFYRFGIQSVGNSRYILSMEFPFKYIKIRL